MPPRMPSPQAPLTYREALVLCEGLFVFWETLKGIKVQPLHDGHKLPRACLVRGKERGKRWSVVHWGLMQMNSK